MSRIARLSVTAVLAATPLIALTAAPVSAQTIDPIQCVGEQVAHYGPPLGPTLEDTTVHIKEDYPSCVGAVLEGRGERTVQQLASCLVPPPPVVPPNVITYHWDEANPPNTWSEVTYTVTTVTRPPGQTVVVSIGTVTDGRNEGAPAKRVVVLPDLDLTECLEDGIEEQRGPAELTIG